MATTYVDWDSTWSSTSIDGTALADGSSLTTAAISNDGKNGTEVSVTCAYGTSNTQGIIVYVLRDIDGTNYESSADVPFGYEMPVTISTTHRRTITVHGDRVSKFKVYVENNTGDTVTPTVRYRQNTIVTSA